MTMVETGSCATMLQIQQKLNLTELPQDQQVESLWSPNCYASSWCTCLLVVGLLAAVLVYGVWSATPPEDEVKVDKSSRNPHVDNAKFLGMVMVCWSHLGGLALKGRTKDLTLEQGDVIWFHMPVFIFLSGSFVRPFSVQLLMKTFVTLVMPLMFFIVILWPLTGILTDEDGLGARIIPSHWLYREPSNEESFWSLPLSSGPGYYIWFLRCLIIWRVVGMFTCQLPKTLQIFVAVISACLGVYFPPNPSPSDNSLGIFAIQRALCLFPIFVLGQHLDLQGLLRVIPGPSKISHPCVAVAWLLIMSLIAIENQQETWRTVTFGAFDSMNSQPLPFMQYQPDTKCPGDQYFAWARIFSALIYRVICMFLFLLFAVPREKTWFTEAGSRTFYPYLLHFPFMAWLNWTLCWLNNEHGWHLFDPGYFNFMRLAFGLTCYYVLLVYGLSSKPVVMLFSPLLEPTWIQRLFRHGLPPKEVVMKG